MKILLRVLGVLTVIISLVISSLGVVRSFRDAEDAKEYEAMMVESKKQLEEYRQQSEQLEGAEKESMLAIVKSGEDAMTEIPSASTFTILGVLMVVITLIILLSGVFLFVINPKIANMLFISAILISVIAIVMSPDLGESMTGGVPNRKLSMIVGGGAFLSALFPFLLARKKS